MSFLLHTLTLSASYAFIGGAIKFLDDVYDQNRQFQGRPLICWFLLLCIVVLVDLWAVIDVFSAVLALALVIGLLATQKVDNLYFAIAALATIPIILYSIFRIEFIPLILPLVTAFTPAVVADELLHPYASRVSSRFLRWVVARRPILKILVLILPFLGLYPLSHAIAFWSFDITYDVVAYWLRAPVITAE